MNKDEFSLIFYRHVEQQRRQADKARSVVADTRRLGRQRQDARPISQGRFLKLQLEGVQKRREIRRKAGDGFRRQSRQTQFRNYAGDRARKPRRRSDRLGIVTSSKKRLFLPARLIR
jgi:hypothetical protein